MNSVKRPCSPRVLVAQCVESLPGVQEVTGSIPVGDSEFFFVPRSCHVAQFTLEFKLASFEKGNNLYQLITILDKAEERSVIQISFTAQDWNIKTGIIRNLHQNSHLIHNTLCFQNP